VKGDADLPNRIDTTLANAREAGRSALGPYITVGYPDVPTSTDIAEAVLESGADMLELGIPFSDPLADGATIQASGFHALNNGVTLDDCIEVVAKVRDLVPDTPLIPMGYYNPFLRYGLSRFAQDAQKAGVDGLIVPDLPAEEAGPLIEECKPRGIHLVPMLAPTSTDERIRRACSAASGFIYCVSLTGVTGARDQLPPGVFHFLESVRRHTALPLAVGFGISRRDHVEALGKGAQAQAAVVGSALINVIMGSPREELSARVRQYVQELSGAIPSTSPRARPAPPGYDQGGPDL
jgi:tryptophan synthase alpha chain